MGVPPLHAFQERAGEHACEQRVREHSVRQHVAARPVVPTIDGPAPRRPRAKAATDDARSVAREQRPALVQQAVASQRADERVALAHMLQELGHQEQPRAGRAVRRRPVQQRLEENCIGKGYPKVVRDR